MRCVLIELVFGPERLQGVRLETAISEGASSAEEAASDEITRFLMTR
jgi:hypothetical protein